MHLKNSMLVQEKETKGHMLYKGHIYMKQAGYINPYWQETDEWLLRAEQKG